MSPVILSKIENKLKSKLVVGSNICSIIDNSMLIWLELYSVFIYKLFLVTIVTGLLKLPYIHFVKCMLKSITELLIITFDV